MNNDLIQSSFPETPTDDLRSRVRGRVNLTLRRRKIVKRSIAGGIGTVTLIGAFMVLPVTRGMAALYQMGSALEDVKAFHSTSYSVLDDGTTVKTGEMVYDEGKWRIQENDGELVIYNEGQTFTYDDWMNVYIRESKPNGPFSKNMKGIGLVHLLGPNGFRFVRLEDDRDVNVGGRRLRRVQVKSNNLPEWTYIYADPVTGLPQKVENLGVHNGRKQLRGTMEFSYAKPDPKLFLLPHDGSPAPLKAYPYFGEKVDRLMKRGKAPNIRPNYLITPGSPVQPLQKIQHTTPGYILRDFVTMDVGPTILEKKQWERERARKISNKIVARKMIGKTQIVIHDLAVQPDGTVWVTYQAGRHSGEMGDFELGIEGQTTYAPGPALDSSNPIWAGNPRVQIEYRCLVPVKSASRASRFSLIAIPNGKAGTTVGSFDGVRYAGDTPKYIKYGVGNMTNPVQVEILKAQAVARYWEAKTDKEQAITAHRRVLDLMQDHARKGYGTWNEESERKAIRRLESLR